MSLINQKYPAPKAELKSIIIALFFGLFIALFLIFFEPFNINLSTNKNKTLQLLFFGCITFFVLLIFLYILPLILPKIFSDEHWYVKNQILFYTVVLFVIATFNGIYTNYINSLPFSWYNYWWIINRTVVLGGIPIAFLTVLDYHKKNSLNRNKALDMEHIRKNFKKNTKEITHTIATDLKNETVIVDENSFYYAKAVGNYIDLYVLVKDRVKKTTYRVT